MARGEKYSEEDCLEIARGSSCKTRTSFSKENPYIYNRLRLAGRLDEVFPRVKGLCNNPAGRPSISDEEYLDRARSSGAQTRTELSRIDQSAYVALAKRGLLDSVFPKKSDLTGDCENYLLPYSERKAILASAWTGEMLSELAQRHPEALSFINHAPDAAEAARRRAGGLWAGLSAIGVSKDSFDVIKSVPKDQVGARIAAKMATNAYAYRVAFVVQYKIIQLTGEREDVMSELSGSRMVNTSEPALRHILDKHLDEVSGIKDYKMFELIKPELFAYAKRVSAIPVLCCHMSGVTGYSASKMYKAWVLRFGYHKDHISMLKRDPLLLDAGRRNGWDVVMDRERLETRGMHHANRAV